MTTVSGSDTIFKGDNNGETERHEIVLTFSLKAGETVYKGQAVALDQDTNQDSSPTAGFAERGSTNGVVLAPTDMTAAVVGICLENRDDSDTSDNEYGKRTVPVLIKGITVMRCVVNATGTGAGYELPIKVGDPALIGGGASTGASTVSGFTALAGAAYAIATGSTDGSSNTQIGWFLDSQNGHATYQTISDGTATIAASQAQNPSTWVRVYVDMPAAKSGGTLATWSI